MSATAISPVDRVTVVFTVEPEPTLRCSHCNGEVTDADPECPVCESPIDWGASDVALREWEAHPGTRAP
jgi:hypothetical protein